MDQMFVRIVLAAWVLMFSVVHGQSLALSVSPNPVSAYFNATFSVTASIGAPLVVCGIACPGIQPSYISFQMTSTSASVPVPAPGGYNGTCTASVEAIGYTPASSLITVVTYAACRTGSFTSLSLSMSTPRPLNINVPNSGPLGYIEITNYQFSRLSGSSLNYNNVFGQLQKSGASLLTFYQSSCSNWNNGFSAIFNDSSTNSLTECAKYGTAQTSFRPFTLFDPSYGIDSSGTFTFTTSTTASGLIPGAVSMSARVCITANYIIAQTASSTFVPGEAFVFTVRLGLGQTQLTTGGANFVCGATTVAVPSFNLGTAVQTVTINAAPTATSGAVCTLSVFNSPTTAAYAAPTILYLTAPVPTTSTIDTSTEDITTTTSATTSAEVTTTTSEDVTTSTASIVTTDETITATTDTSTSEFTSISSDSITTESITTETTTSYDLTSTETIESTSMDTTTNDLTSTEASTTEFTSTTSDSITSESASTHFTTATGEDTTTATEVTTMSTSTTEITSTTEESSSSTEMTTTSTSPITTTTAPVVTPTLLLSASPATQTAGSTISYALYFNPPSTIQSATLILTCDPGTGQSIQTQTGESSSTIQTFQLNAFAMGACTLIATSGSYTSNIIALTVQQQLYVASSLDGWIGGQTVQLNITSLNLITSQIPYTIACSIASISGSVPGSVSTAVALPSIINGVACLLSSSYSGQFYLNLQSTFVNIAMSPAIVQSVVASINPEVFVQVASGVGFSVGNVGNNVGNTVAGVGNAGNADNANQQQQQKKLKSKSTGSKKFKKS